MLSSPLINHLAYYIEYVQTMSMGSNFDEDTLVTSIRKVSNGMKRCSTPRDIPDYYRTLSSPSDLSEVNASPLKNHTLISLWFIKLKKLFTISQYQKRNSILIQYLLTLFVVSKF